MFGFLSSFFSQITETPLNNQNDDNYQLYLINELRNHVAVLEYKNKFTTCFFLTLNENNSDFYYLCTSSNFISRKDIDTKIKLTINLGENYLDNIYIKLDKNQRKIMKFNKTDKIILIQMLPEIDKLSKEKFLKIKTTNYKEYIGGNAKDVYLVGYQNFLKKESLVINCKIFELKDNFKIKLQLEDKNFLTYSPICVINQNESRTKNMIQIIGVQCESDILQDSYGILLGPIIDSLIDIDNQTNHIFNNIISNIIENDNKNIIKNEIENDLNNLDLDKLDNTIGNDNIKVDTYFKNHEMKMLQHNYFYTLEEYQKYVIKFHNLISKYYVSQTTENYNIHYSALKEYLARYPTFSLVNNKFLDLLVYFKDPNKFSKRINDQIINNLNKILSSDNLELIECCSYFIASLMLALYTYGVKKQCLFVNNGDRLYKRVNLNYEDIKRFEQNKNRIILFKTFLNEMTTLEHTHGLIYKEKIDITLVKSDSKFDTKIYIIHNFDESTWKASCINLSTMLFPEKVINLFTFFKVLIVDVDYGEKSASITLGTVGKRKILEEEIANLNNKFKVQYDNYDNVIKVV